LVFDGLSVVVVSMPNMRGFGGVACMVSTTCFFQIVCTSEVEKRRQ
jgi:hypothetical protein